MFNNLNNFVNVRKTKCENKCFSKGLKHGSFSVFSFKCKLMTC